jgi:hypothetical protein
MAKHIDRGSGSEEDPIFFHGWTISPVLKSAPSTRSGKGESTSAQSKLPKGSQPGRAIELPREVKPKIERKG